MIIFIGFLRTLYEEYRRIQQIGDYQVLLLVDCRAMMKYLSRCTGAAQSARPAADISHTILDGLLRSVTKKEKRMSGNFKRRLHQIHGASIHHMQVGRR